MIALLAVGCARGARPDEPVDTYQARKQLARELVARQDWAGAFFYTDELHRQRPEDAEVLVLRGIVYRERGLPAEAEADLKAAVAQDERSAQAHAALGILYDMTQRGDEAEGHHRKATTLAPTDPRSLNNLGFSLFLRGKHGDAVEAYRRAVRLAPPSRRIRTNLGFALAAHGDLPRAAREFEMGGTPAEAKNNLGFAYEQRGDLKNAFDLYVAAVRLDPRYAKARVNLTHVASKLGKPIPEGIPEPPAARSGESAKP